MDIKLLSQSLLKIYDEMDLTFSQYQQTSGLNCLSGCGHCCLNPDIHATVLEMLPMALFIIEKNQVDFWFELLKNNQNQPCVVYQKNPNNPNLGKCEMYQYRPTICRVFGASGVRDKNGEVKLSVCKLIKESKNEIYYQLKNEQDESVPMMTDWTHRLLSVDPKLLDQPLPINEALLKSLEKVLLIQSFETKTIG